MIPTDIYCCCCLISKSCPTLWARGLQHSRLPCPLLSPGVCSNSSHIESIVHCTFSRQRRYQGGPFRQPGTGGISNAAWWGDQRKGCEGTELGVSGNSGKFWSLAFILGARGHLASNTVSLPGAPQLGGGCQPKKSSSRVFSAGRTELLPPWGRCYFKPPANSPPASPAAALTCCFWQRTPCRPSRQAWAAGCRSAPGQATAVGTRSSDPP